MVSGQGLRDASGQRPCLTWAVTVRGSACGNRLSTCGRRAARVVRLARGSNPALSPRRRCITRLAGKRWTQRDSVFVRDTRRRSRADARRSLRTFLDFLSFRRFELTNHPGRKHHAVRHLGRSSVQIGVDHFYRAFGTQPDEQSTWLPLRESLVDEVYEAVPSSLGVCQAHALPIGGLPKQAFAISE